MVWGERHTSSLLVLESPLTLETSVLVRLGLRGVDLAVADTCGLSGSSRPNDHYVTTAEGLEGREVAPSPSVPSPRPVRPHPLTPPGRVVLFFPVHTLDAKDEGSVTLVKDLNRSDEDRTDRDVSVPSRREGAPSSLSDSGPT